MNPNEIQQLKLAVATLLAKSPVASRVASPEQLLTAYSNNDWTNIKDMTGKPFSARDQQRAVRDAEIALAPEFNARKSYETAMTEDALQNEQDQFGDFLSSEAESFKENKDTQDLNAADNGVLFSGARYQKLNNLRNTFEDRQNQERRRVEQNIGSTARDYQYKYGNENAKGLSSMYKVQDGNMYNPQSVQNSSTPSNKLSSIYNPSKYNFQGTSVVSNKAAVQQRANNLLSNKANKLSMSGYKNKY